MHCAAQCGTAAATHTADAMLTGVLTPHIKNQAGNSHAVEHSYYCWTCREQAMESTSAIIKVPHFMVTGDGVPSLAMMARQCQSNKQQLQQ